MTLRRRAPLGLTETSPQRPATRTGSGEDAARASGRLTELTPSEVPDEVRPSMVENAERLPTLQQVHQYVAHTLSRLETLEPDRFPLTQQILNRSGKPCGIYYCLHGPRAVRLTAIWETEQNTILFYGSCGKRLQRTRLLEAPMIEA